MPRDYMNLYGPKEDDRPFKSDTYDFAVQTGPVPVEPAPEPLPIGPAGSDTESVEKPAE